MTSFNILADTGGTAENTVVVRGHLDSVRQGPGINDSPSGVVAMLEIAPG
ncbi:MAG: M28 family peptidase [Arthrobacter sp.]